jgi:uncharacterized protein (DUF2384 family)
MASRTELLIRQIEDLFGDIYAADEVKLWLDTPQGVLDDRRPIDLIESGQGETVIKAVNEVLDNITI